MNGIVLRAVAIHFSNFAELTLDDSGSIVNGTGLALEILKHLREKMNFEIELIHSRDGNWGAVESDGTWNGMVGMLMDGSADICTTALSVTLERSQVIDYAIAFDKDIDTLIIKVHSYFTTNDLLILFIILK